MKQYKNTPYFITEDGKVFRNGKQLKTQISRNGYEYIIIKYNDKRTIKYIHRLVAETYIANDQNKTDVNHINGIKTNNVVSNLEWLSRSENLLHSTRVLRKKTGEDHNMSKLKLQDIEFIRTNYIPKNKSFGMHALSKKFNVSPSLIHKIIHHKIWV